MRRQHLLFYGIAAVVLVVGMAVFGFSPSTLFVLAFLVLCPLMMIVMMGSMHGDGMGHGSQDDSGHQHGNVGPSAGRSGGDSR